VVATRWPDPEVVPDQSQGVQLAKLRAVIACGFPSASIADWIAAGVPEVSEPGRIHDVEYVDLPTGHWPQFTRPADLAAAILAAVR
jgi:hypothetical protein